MKTAAFELLDVDATPVMLMIYRVVSWSACEGGSEIELDTGKTLRVRADPAEVKTKIEQDATSTQMPLTRQGIKALFDEIDDVKWRGLFDREKTNGLAACRIADSQACEYDPQKLAVWLCNHRYELKRAEIFERIRLTGACAELGPSVPTEPLWHDPFKLRR